MLRLFGWCVLLNCLGWLLRLFGWCVLPNYLALSCQCLQVCSYCGERNVFCVVHIGDDVQWLASSECEGVQLVCVVGDLLAVVGGEHVGKRVVSLLSWLVVKYVFSGRATNGGEEICPRSLLSLRVGTRLLPLAGRWLLAQAERRHHSHLLLVVVGLDVADCVLALEFSCAVLEDGGQRNILKLVFLLLVGGWL